MEALLSLAFDNLSSSSPEKIKKGLRQVDLLLAQICLPKQSTKAPIVDKRRSAIIQSSPVKASAADKRRSFVETPASKELIPAPPKKQLSELKDDPAFREFFKLQDGFEWNVATRLVAALERLLGKNDEANDVLIATTLELTQGILLLHPPSRRLFSKEVHMNVSYPSSPTTKSPDKTNPTNRSSSTSSNPKIHPECNPQPSIPS